MLGMNRWINFGMMVVIAMVAILGLKLLGVPMPLALVVTYLLLVVYYLAVALVRRNRRMALLDKVCDPVAFIEATHRQEKLTGKKLAVAEILKIDYAVGHLCLGEEEKALELLLSINQQYLRNKQVQMVYAIDLMISYYQLGHIQEAEKLYAEKIAHIKPMTKTINISLRLLPGDRYYYMKMYKECIEYYENVLLDKQLTKQLKPRHLAGIHYTLGHSYCILGDKDKGAYHLKLAIEYGNELALVSKAEALLENGCRAENVDVAVFADNGDETGSLV